MNTQERLARIRAKCMELLEIASKRTPGKWMHSQGELCSHWVSRADQLSNICEINTVSCYTAPETSQNARFIAACAGPAEAGWKATIAAIDWIQSIRHNEGPKGTYELLNNILAAFPEDCL